MPTPGEVFQATPVSYGGGRVIASPFQFSLTDDDNLQIVSANSLTGVALTIQGRRLTPAGKIEPFAFQHIPNTDRSTLTQNFKLGAGSLLNLAIFASSGAPKIGQTYVMARLIRGLSAATLLLGGVLGGYVTATQALAYPGSPIKYSFEDGGVIRSVTGTLPAAGNNVLETVPPGARWELIACCIQLAANAVVGNRIVQLSAFTPALVKVISPAVSIQVESTTVFYQWAVGLTNLVKPDSGAFSMPWPNRLQLLAGETLRTQTTALNAGDQFTAPQMTVIEWLEVDA